MTGLIAILVIASTFAGFVILIRYAAKWQEKKAAVLERLGGELGFEVKGGEPMMPNVKWLSSLKHPRYLSGLVDGRMVILRHFTRGSGKHQTHHAELAIHVRNPKALELKMTPEGAFHRLGKKLGMSEVETGHERFDREWFINSKQAELVKIILFPEWQEALLSWRMRHNAKGGIYCEPDKIRYEEVGQIQDEPSAARFREMVPLLSELAAIVDAV